MAISSKEFTEEYLPAIIPIAVLVVLLTGLAWIIHYFGLSPLLIAVLAGEIIGLVWLANELERRGLIRPREKLMIYGLVVVAVMGTWGLVEAGYLPLIAIGGAVPMSKFHAFAVITASMYAFLGFIIVTAILGAIYALRGRGK